jgi:glycogen phosphorylase
MLPRQVEIIYEINRGFLGNVRGRFPADKDRIQQVSLIEDGSEKKVRMANLAVVGSHSTNGVAEIHSNLLRETTLQDLAEIFPERFNNKTNGVTPQRWLQLCNPELSKLITSTIGDGWIKNLSELSELKAFTSDSAFLGDFINAKRKAKLQFCEWLLWSTGLTINPDSIFDCQVKRIHEYKRQFLNALGIVVLYNRLRQDPGLNMQRRTFFLLEKPHPHTGSQK